MPVAAAADNAAQLKAAGEALKRSRADLAEVEDELAAMGPQDQELVARQALERARVVELEALLPELEAAAAEESRRASWERAERQRLAERGDAIATLRRDLEVRATGVEQRRALLSRRLAEVERRLEGNVAEREKAERRRAQLLAKAEAVARLRSFVEQRLHTLEQVLGSLREQRRAETETLRTASEELEGLRRYRSGVERDLLARREQISRAELEESQVRARLEALTETVRRELDCEPDALGTPECPPLPPGTSAPSRARELERELRLMGPVNPLALEEYAALQERHEFLEGQLHDVSAARRELGKVIKAVDAEIITVFKAAYDDVAENFATLVGTLFPGGHGLAFVDRPVQYPRLGRGARGPSGRKEHPATFLAFRRGAQPGGPRFPICRFPQPAVAVLHDGRGRAGARRRQFAPVPGSVERVPHRIAVAGREPPKADDGGGGLPLRREHASGGLVLCGQ